MPRRRISHETDTIVIGAGAAGLAATQRLAAHGERVLLVEARDRVGGRIQAQAAGDAWVPAQLGAEFVHGESRAVLDALRATGQAPVDASGERWIARDGGLRRAGDQFADLRRRLRRLRAPHPDTSLAEFLLRHRRTLPPSVRQFASYLVQGFDAADPADISAAEVLDEWSGPAAADGRTFRPNAGYAAMTRAMAASLPHDALWLESIVETVEWRRGRVLVTARRPDGTVRLQARRAVIALPLGVLQAPKGAAAHVRFEPGLAAKREALAHLASGPAVKLLLHFRDAFWESLEDGRFRNAMFFLAPGQPLPTFWTSLPVRTSTLVAWCGGPNTAHLQTGDNVSLERQVMASLRAVFGRHVRRSMLDLIAWHDWQRDPRACGAYSYVRTGGATARRRLARPLDATLFFAGEACDAAGEAATVGGALHSGLLAARAVLRAAGTRQ